MIAAIIEELPDKDELRRVMEKGGCMTTVEELGLSRKIIRKTMQISPYMRNRLTLMRFLKMMEID